MMLGRQRHTSGTSAAQSHIQQCLLNCVFRNACTWTFIVLGWDKHTTGLIFDDDVLIQFLRVKKYNVAKAFSQIKSYISLRKKNPQIFLNLSYEWVVKTLYDRTITFLPWRCQDGCTVIIVELDNWDPETFPVEQVKKAFVIYLLQSLREPMSQVNGIKAIIDVKSNPIRHVRHCTPNNLRLIYHGIQEVCPSRYKEVHIINDSLTFKAAWFIIKPFISEKIKKRINFHNGPETLLNFFPKAILPKHYGGDLENFQMWDWLKRVTTPERLATVGGIQNWPSENEKRRSSSASTSRITT
ncbi:Alpha-tocopherol transfer protein-like [Araneus ventricosus]|uniref:Alpha-tocopherol transfer protein-like n=1 Tax=Araneus ventricosus TaxID=182803 RepID=A0A4Y2U4Z0_ARAVE|nr:Alpha-tocopherol transfer protein-like [Araneus ventricosus]